MSSGCLRSPALIDISHYIIRQNPNNLCCRAENFTPDRRQAATETLRRKPDGHFVRESPKSAEITRELLTIAVGHHTRHNYALCTAIALRRSSAWRGGVPAPHTRHRLSLFKVQTCSVKSSAEKNQLQLAKAQSPSPVATTTPTTLTTLATLIKRSRHPTFMSQTRSCLGLQHSSQSHCPC